MKVYIRPDFDGPDRGEGGIRRWVEAQRRYLPQFGIEPSGEQEADIVAVHAGDMVNTSKPLVCHNHGLYATAQQHWDRWAWMLNSYVIENLRRSNIATVPSLWVAEQVARGMSLDARVLYAGIEPEEWQSGENLGYILWNKTRADPVCDPAPMNRLAADNPAMKFISTFGLALPNIQLTGRLPFEEAKKVLQGAAVYLCTARETFGIGTLEAMACGVPVVGWAWGGQVEIIEQGKTGYLAKPGDYAELNEGLKLVLGVRDSMGKAAREAVQQFTWQRAMEYCASIYEEAYTLTQPRPKVTVLVTVYDLERYLPECLDSVMRQTMADWECVVVDDCSPGNCKEIVEDYARKDGRFKYVRTPRNLYLAGARNWGMGQARGKYVFPLDTDDMLGERALMVLSDFLDANPGVAISYGAMQVMEESDGSSFVSGWPQDFRWENQMAGHNSLPYGSMYRREVWRRTGGYRERCQTSEDNDFWCRVTSFGFRAAKVSNYPTLVYRHRKDSMSGANVWPDCTLWYPWAKDRKLTPFGSVGNPGQNGSWPVKLYVEPTFSVVIPVGPGHENLVRDALDSVLAQSDDRWEAIVVNDSDREIDLSGFPWARLLKTPRPRSGPAVARNVGIEAARGQFFVCLDADDYLMPQFLEHTFAVWQEQGGYVYTDWFEIHEDSNHQKKEAAEFSVDDLLWKGLEFTVTALCPKAFWETVGGFDPNCGGWEDWDFYWHLATEGICGTRLPEPLFCYRYYAGQRREDGYAKEKENAAALRAKWRDYTRGDKIMACRSCGKGGGGRVTAVPNSPVMRQISEQQVKFNEAKAGNLVLMEYTGKNEATQIIVGPRSGQKYRFGANPQHRQAYVFEVDVPGLLERVPFLKPMVTPLAQEAPQGPPQVRQSKNRILVGA